MKDYLNKEYLEVIKALKPEHSKELEIAVENIETVNEYINTLIKGKLTGDNGKIRLYIKLLAKLIHYLDQWIKWLYYQNWTNANYYKNRYYFILEKIKDLKGE